MRQVQWSCECAGSPLTGLSAGMCALRVAYVSLTLWVTEKLPRPSYLHPFSTNTRRGGRRRRRRWGLAAGEGKGGVCGWWRWCMQVYDNNQTDALAKNKTQNLKKKEGSKRSRCQESRNQNTKERCEMRFKPSCLWVYSSCTLPSVTTSPFSPTSAAQPLKSCVPFEVSIRDTGS